MSKDFSYDALVLGLICLDIIPGNKPGGGGDFFVPGKLVEVADAVLSTGGATSNTGLALHRLGFKTSIGGKVGDDFFGKAIRTILAAEGDHLVGGMMVSPGSGTSYSIIINPPNRDRMILHSPGCNDTFTDADVPDAILDARLLHFGYPPLMRSIYENDGIELEKLFRRGKMRGMTTSLDMARPDPDSPAGKIEWRNFFKRVLPWVDVFLPSIDELLFMMDRPRFNAIERAAKGGNVAAHLDVATIGELADAMLAMGPAMVGYKLGDAGFYVKVTENAERLAAMGSLCPPDVKEWRGAELMAPCRRVTVAGTIGAGDCTIAGFLGALLRGLGPDEAVAMAVAAGAASTEVRDANSGVPSWEVLERRLTAGWPQLESTIIPDDWEVTRWGNRRKS